MKRSGGDRKAGRRAVASEPRRAATTAGDLVGPLPAFHDPALPSFLSVVCNFIFIAWYFIRSIIAGAFIICRGVAVS